MFDYNEFSNPSSQYRSAPFWSWNGKLEEQELRAQILKMHEQGMGGFFMHPRGGMYDEYMGADYMEAVRVCVDEAEKLGMKAWLYDEDRFPSGGAGGFLTRGHDEMAAKALHMRVLHADEVRSAGMPEGCVRVFTRDGDAFTDITGDDAALAACAGDVTAFCVEPVGRRLLWNNERYGDLMDADAVARFIKLTHEPYKRAFGAHFGGVIPGIFTDEPSIEVGRGAPRVAWSATMEDVFKEKKGYSLLDNVYKLFVAAGDYRKVRYDYWDVASGMFVQNFTAQIERWCADNNMQFTGHFWEHVFPNPGYTGSVMPNYAHMQYPGIDMLFNTDEYTVQFGNVFIVKELSSIKNQLGKQRAISETHGASGWELDFIDQKKFVDWQCVLGVDFVCQHLMHYTLEGYRKRDFPLSFLYQPWWNEYKLLGDYIGRMSYVASQGVAVADVLVLHPSLSTYTSFDTAGSNAELDAIDQSVKWLTRALCETRVYYDLGDEVVMEEHAAVEGAALRVGNVRYTTVVAPHVTNMKRRTFELLRRFAGNGGHIIAVGGAPHMLEGVPAPELEAFFASAAVEHIAPDKYALAERLGALGCRGCDVAEDDDKDISDVYCCERDMGDRTALIIANIDRKGPFAVRVRMSGAYVECLDAFTGESAPLQLYKDARGYYARLALYPAQSHLLLIDKARAAQVCQEPAAPAPARRVTIPADTFAAKREHPNALTIQTVRYRMGDGAWSDTVNVVAAFDAIRAAMGLEAGNIFQRQPWMFTADDYTTTARVEAQYTFRADFAPESAFAALERPDICEVYVNGTRVQPDGGRYVMRDFHTFDIARFIEPGDNTILLRYPAFDIDAALESVYIIGDFALTPSFEITRERRAPSGEWTQSGYPFYSGAMTYTSSFDVDGTPARVELSLSGLKGVAVLHVNGRRAGTLALPPYAADITAHVHAGENEVRLCVMNSLQNLLGPHDDNSKGLVTPGSFYLKGEPYYFDKSGFTGQCDITVVTAP